MFIINSKGKFSNYTFPILFREEEQAKAFCDKQKKILHLLNLTSNKYNSVDCSDEEFDRFISVCSRITREMKPLITEYEAEITYEKIDFYC